MKVTEMNRLIGEFMGYEFVEIGYFGTTSETEWQKKHELWMEDVGLESVGVFMVKVDNLEFHEGGKEYDKDWNELIPVVQKINETLKGETRDGSFTYPHRMMEALKDCYITLVHFNAAKCIEWFNKNPK